MATATTQIKLTDKPTAIPVLFLGFMGLLLLVAIVTGVVLYAPFMRKLAFGEVRRDRSTRVKWLDLHNLLGIVTLVLLATLEEFVLLGMLPVWTANVRGLYWVLRRQM